MIDHGHMDAAFNYTLENDDPGYFPFIPLGLLLRRLDGPGFKGAGRRLILLRLAVTMWRQIPSSANMLERCMFVRHFGQYWKEFPAEEALAAARMMVDRAMAEPDAGCSSQYADGIEFSSQRQNVLFQILHVLRHLDPAFAQSLVDSHDELAAAVRRYPNGLETLKEEADAKRQKLDGMPGGDAGNVLASEASDLEHQRRLIEASRSGDFARSIADALGKYHGDTPATRSDIPKEYWPSTGVCRKVFYEAGKRLGTDAVKLLERIPDDDLRLFASIELAAGMAGVPGAMITQMWPSNLRHHGSFGGKRITRGTF